jgi:hypothetical protein
MIFAAHKNFLNFKKKKISTVQRAVGSTLVKVGKKIFHKNETFLCKSCFLPESRNRLDKKLEQKNNIENSCQISKNSWQISTTRKV